MILSLHNSFNFTGFFKRKNQAEKVPDKYLNGPVEPEEEEEEEADTTRDEL